LTLEDAADDHIEAKRIGTVPGTHTVNYDSSVDSIEITYSSQPRGICTLG
jgi:4-hydroxy-tetrahydrodipicolinate reductase